ncbi:unnamed protein product [Microthlaspi erraticum]|uniref:Uncharacterized protein n=1 Tax=Microthlaspi erraticum TaxID=1685480 RepID=A0A6D2KF62_9BRAS|nr:unnamed protein product [Microthlaspi erraticum]
MGHEGAWRDLAHGSSSTGYAKEEGRSHLEDQLDRPRPTGRVPQLDRPSFNSIELRSQQSNPKNVFWSILEHMGHKEHGGTWHMEAAQLDTQRKKGEAILKTSSTVYSTNRSSSSTRPAKLQLDRAGVKVKPEKCCFPLDFL